MKLVAERLPWCVAVYRGIQSLYEKMPSLENILVSTAIQVIYCPIQRVFFANILAEYCQNSSSMV